MAILDSLKEFPNWICWKRIKKRKPNGDTVIIKLPVNPHTGEAASTVDPSTWGTYEEAANAYRFYHNIAGLGFVFTKNAGVIGVDLDHCVQESGNLTPLAEEIVDFLNSYTEYSPSDTGLHIYVFGEIPHNIKRNLDGVEIYGEGRYFTVTGKHFAGTPTTIEHRKSEICKVVDQYTENKKNEIVTPDDIRAMLSKIPNSGLDYDAEWIRILMAIHSVYPGATGLQLAKEWCESTSAPGEIDAKFLSFSRSKRTGVGIGTLVYIAKKWGWKPEHNPLDRVYPPLSLSQKAQVQDIIDQVVEERLWEKYHKQMTVDLYGAIGLPARAIDHYQIGYRCSDIDTETGEILDEAYTVPFFSCDGTVVDIEYRMKNQRYDYTIPYASMFYALPMMGEDDPSFAVVLPDSLCAINAYLKFGQLPVGSNRVGFWGLPHTELSTLSLDELSHIDNVVFVLGRDIDPRDFLSFKDRARFLQFPIDPNTAVNMLAKADFKRMLNQAEPINSLL